MTRFHVVCTRTSRSPGAGLSPVKSENVLSVCDIFLLLRKEHDEWFGVEEEEEEEEVSR